MYCSKCGKELSEGAKFCDGCGNKIENGNEVKNTNTNSNQKKEVPKCTHCGYVGEWEVGPILRPIDFIIGVAFLFLGVVPGLIYWSGSSYKK